MDYLRAETAPMINEDQMSPLLGRQHCHTYDFEEYVTSLSQNPLLSICSNQSSDIVELDILGDKASVVEEMSTQQHGDLFAEDLFLRQETPKDLLSLVTSDHI